MGDLDQFLVEVCTPTLIEREFNTYLAQKTDTMKTPSVVNVEMGVDGVSWKAYKNNLSVESKNLANRVVSGKHLFQPFREVIKSKTAGLSWQEAVQAGKERIISIACIRDVIFQRILYSVVTEKVERQFRQLSNVSFAYRKGLSAPAAARQLYRYMKEGFTAVLDADIKKFFDCIPHVELQAAVERILGTNNPLVCTYMKRFYKADRVQWETYGGRVELFHRQKPHRTHRTIGIPQGGVLSGLLANMYLHQFDTWVMDELNVLLHTEIRYVRYADDFVILFRDVKSAELAMGIVRGRLESLKLTLHPDSTKTRVVDLTVKGTSVAFVGFSISPTGIRVKDANMSRFKERIKDLLNKSCVREGRFERDMAFFIQRQLMFKLLGNATQPKVCVNCGKIEARRSWIDFFLTLTDVQQLRGLDTWLRRQLYTLAYHRCEKRLTKRKLQEFGLDNLESIYYRYRKMLGQEDFCRCDALDQELEVHGVDSLLEFSY